MINLNIDSTTENTVEESFKRIASELINNYGIHINGHLFRFTELEFYYYHPNHMDKYTHEHDFQISGWRFHNQGLDITFPYDDVSDGGILIRGIEWVNCNSTDSNTRYINGPKKIITAMFRCFDLIHTEKNTFGLVLMPRDEKKVVSSLPRIGLNEGTCSDFHKKHYRYYVDADAWSETNRKKFITPFID